MIACLLLGAIHGRSEAAVTIERISSPVLYVDANSNFPAKYVAYRVTNTGPGAIHDAWVSIGSFSGGALTLATHEDGWYHIGLLPAGQSAPAYFLLTAVATMPSSHQVFVHGQPWVVEPPIASGSFDVTVGQTLSAQANPLNTWISAGDPPEVGSQITLYVQGETGTLGSSGVFAHSAATLPSFRSDAFELMGSHVATYSPGLCGSTFLGAYPDLLYYLPEQSNCFVIGYTFRCTRPMAVETPMSPNVAVSSGQFMKHAGSVAEVSLPPTINRLRIAHVVAPATLPFASAVTCTVRIHNEGQYPARLDMIAEDLPNAPAPVDYIAGTARLDGVPVPDPLAQGPYLFFAVPGEVPAGGSVTLTFEAQVPAVFGQYAFVAEARIGPFTLDETLDPTDNVPATATVTVSELGVEARVPPIATLHGARPDPLRGLAGVRFDLARDAVVRLIVTDLTGRTVAVLADHELRSSGSHTVALDGGALAPGVYVLRLEADGHSFARRMTVLR